MTKMEMAITFIIFLLQIYREQVGEVISEVVAVIIAYDIDGPQRLEMKQYTSNDSDSYKLVDLSKKEMQNYMTCPNGKVIR